MSGGGKFVWYSKLGDSAIFFSSWTWPYLCRKWSRWLFIIIKYVYCVTNFDNDQRYDHQSHSVFSTSKKRLWRVTLVIFVSYSRE